LTTATFTNLVQSDLRRVEDLMRAQAAGHHPDLIAALEHLISAGGKRLRPTLTLLVGKMLGAEDEPLITLAAAVELLHTATLVHDDLIDGSLLRRGIPTLNASWSPAATVLTGDFMFARSADMAAQVGSIRVMRLFAGTLAIIVEGELAQMFDGPGFADRDAYYKRIYAKTASMFILATEGAAALAGVPEEMIQQARCFGHDLGIAYQIVDDILDFTGEQVKLGKPVGSDLRHGLITMPTLCYLEAHPDDADLQTVIAGGVLGNDVVEGLIERIRSSDAIAVAAGEARRFARSALDCLERLPVSEERMALRELANYIVERDF